MAAAVALMDVLKSAASLLGTPRKSALRVLLASIAINAVLGIWALLVDDFGQTQGKILATSFLVSAALLAVLVNGAPLQRRVLWPVPLIAAATAAGAFVLFIVLMWAETDHEVPLKLGFSGLVVGAGATLAGLLALIRLRDGHEPVKAVDYLLTALLSMTAIVGIWMEPDADWYPRLVGVESVLVAAVTMTIPVLAKFAPPEAAPEYHDVAIRFCPSCGRSVPYAPALGVVAVECKNCGANLLISTPSTGHNHLGPQPIAAEPGR